ncbi:high affinity cationic amino acid transporter 1-like [Diadema antillarum]|uniref:high affinity cationic amino acid transporter 1-like n=1 Tax=Diadema antillarum TaxID=105358 RepID=UPI003A8705B0
MRAGIQADSVRTFFGGCLQRLTRTKTLRHEDLTQSELKRCLGLLDLTAIGVGSTLGAGIYVLAGQVAREVAGPAIVLSFLVAAVVSLLSGLCYAEFGARVPKTGSAYTYSYVTIGEFFAFVIGWSMIMDNIIAGASVGKAWSEYLDSMLNATISTHIKTHVGTFASSWVGDYPDFLAFCLLIVVTIVIAFGAKMSSSGMLVLTVINIVVIVFIVGAGAFFVEGQNWTEGAGFFPFGFSGLLAGSATCFYAFVGFDVIATSGEEARNPSKAIPLSIILTLVICLVAYVSVSAVMTLMVRYDELAEFAPLAMVFAQRGLPFAKYVVAVGSMVSLSSSMMGSIFPLPRIIYAMAKDGILFQFLGKINTRTNVPVYAAVCSGVLTAVMALIFNIEQLVEMMSIGTLMSYAMVAVCVLLLRYKPGVIGLDKEEAKRLAEQHKKKKPAEETALVGLAASDAKHKTYTNLSPGEEFNLGTETGPQGDTRGATTPEDAPAQDEQSMSKQLINEKSKGDKSGAAALPREPTLATYRSVVICISIIVVDFVILSIVLIFGEEGVVRGAWWAIVLFVLLISVVVVLLVVIEKQPQNQMELYFRTPFVPYLPVLSVFFNIFLMFKLSTATWIRFVVWLAIGFVIYFGYGMRHSLEETGAAPPHANLDESEADEISLYDASTEPNRQRREQSPASEAEKKQE